MNSISEKEKKLLEALDKLKNLENIKSDKILELTNLSLFIQLGFFGLKFKKSLKSTVETSAIPIGIPGCPDLAFCTASIDKNLIALDKSLLFLFKKYPI